MNENYELEIQELNQKLRNEGGSISMSNSEINIIISLN